MRDFTTKYRPETLDKYWGGNITKERWQGYVGLRRFPKSIILAGGYGQGKTTLALIFCDDIIRLAARNEGAVFGPYLRKLKLSDYERKRVNEMIESSHRSMCSPIVMFMDEAQRMPDKTIQELFLTPIHEYENLYCVFAVADIKDMNPALISLFLTLTFLTLALAATNRMLNFGNSHNWAIVPRIVARAIIAM